MGSVVQISLYLMNFKNHLKDLDVLKVEYCMM